MLTAANKPRQDVLLGENLICSSLSSTIRKDSSDEVLTAPFVTENHSDIPDIHR